MLYPKEFDCNSKKKNKKIKFQIIIHIFLIILLSLYIININIYIYNVYQIVMDYKFNLKINRKIKNVATITQMAANYFYWQKKHAHKSKPIS